MKCPGQDTQYWQPGAIFEARCPECGNMVEFFKDDPTRKCGHCGHRFVNPNMDFGCAAYCKFADQCLGTLPPELLAERADLFKDRVAVEMKRHYRTDFHKIGRAMRAARVAESMAKDQNISPGPILMATYLHEMTVDDARELLEKVKAPEPIVEKVLQLIRDISLPQPPPSTELDIICEARRQAERPTEN
jgi:hypothetical protein